jgi:hypothetical protein
LVLWCALFCPTVISCAFLCCAVRATRAGWVVFFHTAHSVCMACGFLSPFAPPCHSFVPCQKCLSAFFPPCSDAPARHWRTNSGHGRCRHCLSHGVAVSARRGRGRADRSRRTGGAFSVSKGDFYSNLIAFGGGFFRGCFHRIVHALW